MYESINQEIKDAEQRGQKVAAFHFHVLMNTENSQAADAKDFCREVGMTSAFTTEFSKMIALARVIEQHGIQFIDTRGSS